jgi:DMSO/TMAO reductase YedYZ molybdopterin-dependent catalytic subunit
MSDDKSLLGQIKDKLLSSKRKWADESRGLTGQGDRARANRLPPGQHEVKNWPVLDLGIKPDVNIKNWKLQVDGLVDNPLSLDFSGFMALPQIEDVSDIHCVTTWSRYENHWAGVAASQLLDIVQPTDQARHVILHSYDGYTTNITLKSFADPDVLLAHSWEGAPLTLEHGGPVRLVVPQWYFWKSAKWIKRIEFSAQDRPGFWEVRGYHNEGDPWDEQRYS